MIYVLGMERNHNILPFIRSYVECEAALCQYLPFSHISDRR